MDYCDEKLISEIKAGNLFCFDLLYEKYSRKIYSFAFSILKSREEAENVTQDVFLVFWENRLKIEKCSSIKYYLFTIAYHSSISIIRRKTRESQFLDYLLYVSESEQSANDIEYEDLAVKFEEILSTLPPRQKEIFCLHKREGLKYKEISEKLNLSVNTIENHMSAALKTIRTKLAVILNLLF